VFFKPIRLKVIFLAVLVLLTETAEASALVPCPSSLEAESSVFVQDNHFKRRHLLLCKMELDFLSCQN
jgi:hypothetical protein